LFPPDVIFSLTLKCIKFNFDWGFAPNPTGGAYRAFLDILARFKKFYFQREWTEWKKKKGRGRKRAVAVA